MGSYKIVCVRHDANNVITGVGLEDGSIRRIKEIIERINSEIDSFYTYRDGKHAKIYAKRGENTKKWYLTTEPDSTDENNMDFLPSCNK